ncbi:MAG: T9SS type A sorting domain-containing protein, partial [Flavobacteriales bacterium]
SASRSNPAQALGAPQNNNTINFVALDFGGSVSLKLGYVVFDKEGDDLQIVETSFGNPTCNSYPERALIEVSLNGFYFTEFDELCLDGSVDFAAAGVTAAQYIRITDRSNATQFGGSADGYDVDSVVVLQPGCDASAEGRVFGDNINTPDETASFSVCPNPFKNIVTLEVHAGDAAEQMLVRVMNIAGQTVHTSNVNVSANSRINHTMDLSDLANGVYMIAFETNNGREVYKLINQ